MEQGSEPCVLKNVTGVVEHFYTSSGRWVEAVLNEFALTTGMGEAEVGSSGIDAEPQEGVLAPLDRLREGLESACINMKQRLLGALVPCYFPFQIIAKRINWKLTQNSNTPV